MAKLTLEQRINQYLTEVDQAHAASLADRQRAGENTDFTGRGESYRQNRLQAEQRGETLRQAVESGEINEADLTPTFLKAYVFGDPAATQGFDELVQARGQISKQEKQLLDFRIKAETQMFGGTNKSLAEALSSPQGELGQLSEALRSQQSAVFREELSPLIRQQLGARGLEDSGANVELQAQALGNLERQRQATLLQAALGGKSDIRGLEREDILGNIGAQQSALSNLADLQRVRVTMEYQRALEAERNQLALQLSQMRGGEEGDGTARGFAGALTGALTGAAGGAAGGGPGMVIGGLSGALLGGLGGAFGPSGTAAQGGTAGGAIGAGLFGAQQAPSTLQGRRVDRTSGFRATRSGGRGFSFRGAEPSPFLR